MTDLQAPLRACQSGEVFALFDNEGNYLASIETADVAAEIVRRCNEFEGLRKLLACCLDEWYYEIHVPTEEAIQTKEAVVAALKGTSNE